MPAPKNARKSAPSTPAAKVYEHQGRHPAKVSETPDGKYLLDVDGKVYESLTAAAAAHVLAISGKIRSVNGKAYFGVSKPGTPADTLDKLAVRYAGTPAEKALRAAAEAVRALPPPGPAMVTVTGPDGRTFTVRASSLKPA
jgi:hypothetical protein